MRYALILLLFVVGVCLVRSVRDAGRTPDDLPAEALSAAWDGDHAKLADLVRRGVDPNAEVGGTTLLAAAASCGREAAVELLVYCGAEPDRRVFAGQTPLMLAASGGDAATVRVLLACGADANAADDPGFTVLMHAVMSRDPERVRLVMAAGADPDRRNDSGTRAADIAASHPPILRILAGEEVERHPDTPRHNAERRRPDAGAAREDEREPR